MAKGGGIALKSFSLLFRAVQFSCSAVILAIFSYYLYVLNRSDLPVNDEMRAVTGISGLASIYTFLAMLFVCCFGGVLVLSLLSIVLDIAFAGALAYVSWVNRGGSGRCTARGALGQALFGLNAQGNRRMPSQGVLCNLQHTGFAVAIVAT